MSCPSCGVNHRRFPRECLGNARIEYMRVKEDNPKLTGSRARADGKACELYGMMTQYIRGKGWSDK